MDSAQVSAGGVAETELCPGLFDFIVHDLFSSIIKQMYFKCWKIRYVKARSEEACAHSQCAVSLQDDTRLQWGFSGGTPGTFLGWIILHCVGTFCALQDIRCP